MTFVWIFTYLTTANACARCTMLPPGAVVDFSRADNRGHVELCLVNDSEREAGIEMVMVEGGKIEVRMGAGVRRCDEASS